MAFEEEIQKFTHNVEEAFHDVEEVFQDVKEHVLLSVRSHSYMIAFFLMTMTSAILVFGTVYVWCFHHGRPPRIENESNGNVKESKKERKSKLARLTKRESRAEGQLNSNKSEISVASDEINADNNDVTLKADKAIVSAAIPKVESESQNGGLRMRTGNTSLDVGGGVSPLVSGNASSETSENADSEFGGNTSPGFGGGSSSGGNNNNSPVKSKIPVRRQKSKQS